MDRAGSTSNSSTLKGPSSSKRSLPSTRHENLRKRQRSSERIIYQAKSINCIDMEFGAEEEEGQSDAESSGSSSSDSDVIILSDKSRSELTRIEVLIADSDEDEDEDIDDSDNEEEEDEDHLLNSDDEFIVFRETASNIRNTPSSSGNTQGSHQLNGPELDYGYKNFSNSNQKMARPAVQEKEEVLEVLTSPFLKNHQAMTPPLGPKGYHLMGNSSPVAHQHGYYNLGTPKRSATNSLLSPLPTPQYYKRPEDYEDVKVDTKKAKRSNQSNRYTPSPFQSNVGYPIHLNTPYPPSPLTFPSATRSGQGSSSLPPSSSIPKQQQTTHSNQPRQHMHSVSQSLPRTSPITSTYSTLYPNTKRKVPQAPAGPTPPAPGSFMGRGDQSYRQRSATSSPQVPVSSTQPGPTSGPTTPTTAGGVPNNQALNVLCQYLKSPMSTSTLNSVLYLLADMKRNQSGQQQQSHQGQSQRGSTPTRPMTQQHSNSAPGSSQYRNSGTLPRRPDGSSPKDDLAALFNNPAALSAVAAALIAAKNLPRPNNQARGSNSNGAGVPSTAPGTHSRLPNPSRQAQYASQSRHQHHHQQQPYGGNNHSQPANTFQAQRPPVKKEPKVKMMTLDDVLDTNRLSDLLHVDGVSNSQATPATTESHSPNDNMTGTAPPTVIDTPNLTRWSKVPIATFRKSQMQKAPKMTRSKKEIQSALRKSGGGRMKRMMSTSRTLAEGSHVPDWMSPDLKATLFMPASGSLAIPSKSPKTSSIKTFSIDIPPPLSLDGGEFDIELFQLEDFYSSDF